ncbi:ornithine cyclodeaminase family protein [Actinoallomurus iriomotensis]|uniref:Alanine dehydrogenase n=1 Tax=Actinoallomurus iriomotensis TaxID=478107 RepID=A0A9W6RI12_9ACTN|nr:ornithine cyclodeaminase family protein [Actinoallomurus iriomotensis]GLY76426.1 alanine dehydrogenase [Actinoallomurus iriomotensis]
MTLLLNRTELTELLEPDACLEALRAGFLASASAVRPLRVRTDLPGPGTATALIPGLLDGVPAYTVKVNAKFPTANPALRGVVCLHDLATGELLALLDSATVTAYRTGLAAALGTHVLARADASTVAVIGAGAQADLVIRGLRRLRPVHDLLVTDREPARAETFAARHGGRPVTRAELSTAEIVVTATWSREPVLRGDDVAPGTHVTSLGADEPGKAELAADLLRTGRVFVDDVALSLEMGALGNAGLGAADAAGTLSEILDGTTGRASDAEVTVYAPVGLPWQDLALAWLAFRTTRSGTRFDFLA